MSVDRYVVTPNSKLDGAKDSANHQHRRPQVGSTLAVSASHSCVAIAAAEGPVCLAAVRHRSTAQPTVSSINSP